VSVHLRKMGSIAACLLLVLLTAGVAGCGSSGPDETSTTTAITPSTSTTMIETTSTTSPLITEWDRKLKEVAILQNRLTNVLLEEEAGKDDPRMGIIHGLRACTQAIACREALDQHNLDLADTAMQEVRYALNLARDVATGTAGETIAAARATIETLGRPSAAPDEAATMLDDFLATLVPLVDEARALVPVDTTTT